MKKNFKTFCECKGKFNQNWSINGLGIIFRKNVVLYEIL